MCSTALGTFLGRAKNFRQGVTLRDGKEEEVSLADIFLSNSAKETPQGDLHNYVMDMAENEADMFGTSIVFTPGALYKRNPEGNKVYQHVRYSMDGCEVWYTHEDGTKLSDKEEEELSEETFVECDELHADDIVDEPAANDGLFSKFSGETMAGQITEFLDLHPQVWKAIETNPSILEALGRYGDKVDEFTERYREYREQNGRNTNMKSENSEKLKDGTEDVDLETAEPVTDETPETPDVEAAEPEPDTEPETPEPEATPDEPAAEP